MLAALVLGHGAAALAQGKIYRCGNEYTNDPKLAKEKGVKCSINPDAHSERGLQDVLFGVRAARKGWLTRRDVINCLPLGHIETALESKRLRFT